MSLSPHRKEKSMASTAKPSWKPEDLNWPADDHGINIDQESQFQDIFYQKALDRLNEQAAAIFTEPNDGITASARDWQIRSMDYGGPGYGGSLGKELLIKLSEGLERTNTMNLYQVYIVDLKNHSVEKYGPIVARNSAAAERRALAWLVVDANDETTRIEIYDGDIEHYHFFAAKIASCIPDKITNE